MQNHIRSWVVLALILFKATLASAQMDTAFVGKMLSASSDSNLSALLDIKEISELAPKPAKGNRVVARGLNTAALKQMNSGDFAGAVSTFQDAAKADTADIEIANNLSYALVKAKRGDEAVKAAKAAIALEPGRSSSWFNLGLAYGSMGDAKNSGSALDVAFTFSSNREKTAAFYTKLASDETTPSTTSKALLQAVEHQGIGGSDGANTDTVGLVPNSSPPSPDATKATKSVPAQASQNAIVTPTPPEKTTAAAKSGNVSAEKIYSAKELYQLSKNKFAFQELLNRPINIVGRVDSVTGSASAPIIVLSAEIFMGVHVELRQGYFEQAKRVNAWDLMAFSCSSIEERSRIVAHDCRITSHITKEAADAEEKRKQDAEYQKSVNEAMIKAIQMQMLFGK